MCELKIYCVSDEYISYLRNFVPEVYDNKEGERVHTRPYLGIVYNINNFNYYIPLSSPKKTDYIYSNGVKEIRKSIVPIFRVVDTQSNNVTELLGTLRISNMIPVPDSELTLYDLEGESDINYKDLVQKEAIFIRKNKDKIIANAHLLYKQKINNDNTANYINTTIDFKLVEEKFNCFIKERLALN